MAKEKISGIYLIQNKVNLKVYIGKSINIYQRWRDHIRNANSNNRQYERPLYQAIRKYGKDNFIFTIIEECHKEFITKREQYWITFYNSTWPNGYNIYNTAWYNSFEKLTTELVAAILKDIEQSELTLTKISNKYNIAYNLVSDLNRGRINKYRIHDLEYPIRSTAALIHEHNAALYNIWNGNFMKHWPNIKEYLKNNTVTDTCTYFNFSATALKRWLKINKLGKPSDYIVDSNTSIKIKPILQYDLNGNFIASYPSATAASIKLFGVSNRASSILAVCHGKYKTCAGFQWCFENKTDKIKTNVIIGNNFKKQVLCIELNKAFESIEAAAKFVSAKKHGEAIRFCCANKPGYKTAYGYHWKFI